MNIEQEATNAVRTSIIRNPYLSAYVDENDKTPVWDGFVNVYRDKNPNHPKNSLFGRVPIQVKGKRMQNIMKDRIAHRVSKDDLRAFNSEGGVVFLVVLINDKYETQIYYNDLLPLDLARELNKVAKKKSLSLDFRRIPTDEDDLANLFLNFVINRKKQSGTVDDEKLYFNDWDNSLHSIEKYVFSCSAVDRSAKNPFEIFTTTPVYLYMKPKGFNIEIPVDRIDNGVITANNLHTIGIDDDIVYSETSTVWQHGLPSIYFGKGWSLKFQKDKNNAYSKIDLNIKLSGTLDERIKDGEFLVAVIQKKYFMLNDLKLPLNGLLKKDVEKILGILDTLKSLKSILNSLNIKEDLDLDELPDNEVWKIDFLFDINKETKRKLADKEYPLQRINIANLSILILMNENEGKLRIEDYFSTKCHVRGSDKRSVNHTISQFLLLKAEDLICSNFVLENIYDDVIKFNSWDGYSGIVNNFLLEVIRAYDANKGKHEDLYQLGIKISQWLCEQADNFIHRMNYLQLKKREERLSSNEIKDLENELTKSEGDWSLKSGILILLERISEVRAILEKQSLEDQLIFKNYPIFSLISSGDGRDGGEDFATQLQ